MGKSVDEGGRKAGRECRAGQQMDKKEGTKGSKKRSRKIKVGEERGSPEMRER